MFTAFRILASIVPLIATPIHGHQPTSVDSRRVVTVGFTADEQVATTHTISIFAEAGLPLPKLEIRRHHDRTSCDGFEGLHRRFGDRSVIDICTAQSGGHEQRILLHELSHAWTEHYLAADAKRAFQQLRGFTTWLDYQHNTWEDNGAEQAAEILAWGLSEQPISVFKIDHDSCHELRDGYVTLTGQEPLHGYTKLCQPSVTKSTRS
jgi:hypothetical protein